jgi:hypothetical protein
MLIKINEKKKKPDLTLGKVGEAWRIISPFKKNKTVRGHTKAKDSEGRKLGKNVQNSSVMPREGRCLNCLPMCSSRCTTPFFIGREGERRGQG